jgi:hypothetical protein
VTTEIGGPCLQRDGSMVEVRQVECGDAPLLADVYHSAGDADAARRTWGSALRIFKEIEHPGADLISARLTDRGGLVAGEAR